MGSFAMKPRTPLPAGFGGINMGDLQRPQVQDQWGRSPSDPEYGRPPADGAPPLAGPGVPYDPGPGLQPMPDGGPVPGPSTMPTLPEGGGWGQPMPQQPHPGFGGITTQRPANNGASLYALGGGLAPWGGTSWLRPPVSHGFSSPLGSFIRR